MKTSMKTFPIIAAFCTHLILFGCAAGSRDTNSAKPKKYVAFSTDKEAYFMPRDFEHFEGEYTRQITVVCNKYNVPFTWLVVVDKEHVEVHRVAAELFPDRRDTDEFSLHAHFKWFIMDDPDDFESFKILERRMQWLADAKTEIEKAGLPMPRSFRYGGGDSNDSIYYIEDLMTLSNKFGVRNFLFSPGRLKGVFGLARSEHKGNNVWIIDGGRELTLLSTCVYLDEDEKTVISAIGQRLESADYAIIGSHDYREAVPVHMSKAIEYLNANYNIEYVTIDRIGELVRNGEIRNGW
jgi:hypothetical protein